MKIKLIIFDCDGVLVDSEAITNGLLAEMMTEVGIPMTTEKVMDRFMGRATSVWLNFVEEKLGVVPEDFLREFRRRCAEIFEKELQPIKGIEEALDTIPYPYCVASSGPHEKMDVTLRVTNLKDRFEGKIFSAQDVGKGKPAPDIFLHAAQSMGVEPEHCVVVEDTIHGIQAAQAAKMKVFCLTRSKVSKAIEESGVPVFRSMYDLPDLLKNLEN